MSSQPDLPHALQAEYALKACLNQSGDRATLLLCDRVSHRLAVLRITPEESGEAENEYAMLTLFAGPGVPAVYRLFQQGGRSYLLREYIEGQTLAEHLQKDGPMKEHQALRVIRALCRILMRLHAHEPPVIHRDLKAENIILTPSGEVVLIDWGIARFYEQGAGRDTQILGTPAIAPPEQFGYSQTDPRSDVYAAGMLLRALLDADCPGVHVSRGLRRILSRCLQFAPEARYADARELNLALARCERHAKRLHRALPAVSAALCLVAAACCAILLAQHPPAPSTAPSIPPVAFTAPPADDTPYEFASPALERAVRQVLGKPEGMLTRADLLGVTSLVLCGNDVYDSLNALDIHGKNFFVDGVRIAERGGVDTLADLPNLPNLHTLALCSQQISDLSPLAGLPLQRLALHDNAIRDVSPLASCPYLQTLYIGCNPVSDLSPLSACTLLAELNADDTALTSCDSLAGLTALSSLSLFNCEHLSDIEALTQLPALSVLLLRPVSRAELDSISRLTAIRFLYLWEAEALTSLEPLRPLSGLNELFLDSSWLTSLDGLDAFPQMTHLSLLNAALSDLSPLPEAFSITNLVLYQLPVSDFTPLAALPRLSSVECDAASFEAISSLNLGAAVSVR